VSKFNSFLAASILFGCVASASAGTLADVSILDRNTGERLPTWHHEGRLYVAGRTGNRYAVELKNRGGGRLLAVLSVDGVNAITGQTAATSQSGYVLGSWQRAEILGWRKSMDDVAAFYFTRLSDSYAGRTDRPDNVGVIGIAMYREYSEPRLRMEQSAAPWASQAPASKAAAMNGELARDGVASQSRADERLGTGHGERVTSSSQTTAFRRASDQPAEIVTIHYDSQANLIARGVIPGPRGVDPRPFPGGFVPDPG
jgi:hypothetical protein